MPELERTFMLQVPSSTENLRPQAVQASAAGSSTSSPRQAVQASSSIGGRDTR